MALRWLHPRTAAMKAPRRGQRRHLADVDPWLDTIHRLAQARAEERERMVPFGDLLRTRLQRRD